jgi:hypothetical protein
VRRASTLRRWWDRPIDVHDTGSNEPSYRRSELRDLELEYRVKQGDV